MPGVSAKFVRALAYAARVHSSQTRKGKPTPYLAHLLGVAALVLEYGGSGEQAVAALLHDAAEDHGGRPRLRDIRRRFGPQVARIVESCSDSLAPAAADKEDWLLRKTRYLRHLRTAPPAALLVSAADKLHNAREILADVREHGVRVFQRFRGRRKGTLWYYRALVRALRARRGGHRRLVRELARVVRQLERAK
jgi:GTP pyrophosphokinase